MSRIVIFLTFPDPVYFIIVRVGRVQYCDDLTDFKRPQIGNKHQI